MSLQRITCPSCGSNRFSHDLVGDLKCAHCGANFGNPLAEIECPSCGVENPPQARKCMNCGLTLGRVCSVCNHHNPPGADHCLECATPLDTLSKVFMRTAPGREHTSKIMRNELVRTKSEDSVFMRDQRIKLDEEEEQRLRHLRNQQTKAVQQQRAIMTITLFGIGSLICLALLAYLYLR